MMEVVLLILTGSGLDTTDQTFTITTTNSAILSAWQTAANQDFRIKGAYMDFVSDTVKDEIIVKNVTASINGIKWSNVGNHTTGSFVWDTSGLDDQTGIDFRVRAIDESGTNTYSVYYVKGSSLTIQHSTIITVTDILTLGDSGSITKALAPITQTDVLTLGDSATLAYVRSGTDTLTLGDSASITKTLAPITQTDVLTLGDSVILAVGAKSITDTLTLGDSVSITKTLAPITQTDVLTLGDSVTLAVGAKSITDTLRVEPMSVKIAYEI